MSGSFGGDDKLDSGDGVFVAGRMTVFFAVDEEDAPVGLLDGFGELDCCFRPILNDSNPITLSVLHLPHSCGTLKHL